jgi:hypothetical protein
MKQISRRSALYFAATTPALVVSIPSIADADLVLLELGRRFDAISAQLDHELHTEWETLNEFDCILKQILHARDDVRRPSGQGTSGMLGLAW